MCFFLLPRTTLVGFIHDLVYTFEPPPNEASNHAMKWSSYCLQESVCTTENKAFILYLNARCQHLGIQRFNSLESCNIVLQITSGDLFKTNTLRRSCTDTSVEFLLMTKCFEEWWWSESLNCHLSQDHNGTSILCVQETCWEHWRDLITVYLCKWTVQKENLFSEGRPVLSCNVGTGSGGEGSRQ